MLKDKIIIFFLEIDDFYKIFEKDVLKIQRLQLEDSVKRRNRKGVLSDSEMMSILLLFHTGHFTNFKHYYLNFICAHCKDLFPHLISYERFVKRQERLIIPLILFIKNRCLGKSRGINFIDSTKIEVCHIKRENQNKVFSGIAQ